MASKTAPASEHFAIIGLGVTGVSCARYLAARGDTFSFMDSRESPPNLAAVKAEFSAADVHLGEIALDVLLAADQIIVSPGVSLELPIIQQALDRGVSLTSDLDLFRAAVTTKVVCITGSNGKSTVATLLSRMAERDGVKACLCGNIGVPVLDTITQQAELYIVEVSSFQLERCEALRADASVVLNISADHMDRHADLDTYQAVKSRVHLGSKLALINRDDARTHISSDSAPVNFGEGSSDIGGYGIDRNAGREFLSLNGEPIIGTDEILMRGRHNHLNALAALALADGLGISRVASCEELRHFVGLVHRCEFIAEHQGVRYINDSKGTNVGATLAALQGLGSPTQKDIVLIAGGVGKGADFSVLRDGVHDFAQAVVVFGEDATSIEHALQPGVQISRAEDLAHAVKLASAVARVGDTVLFSPACASFDMFDNFEQRGEAFRSIVLAHIGAEGAQL